LDSGLVGVFWFARFLGEVGGREVTDKIGAVGYGLHSTPVGVHSDDFDVLPEWIVVTYARGGVSVVVAVVAGPHSWVGGILHLYAGVIT
jgi:hypothetical protein